MHERRLMDEGASVLEREVLAAWEDEKAPRATRVRAARLAVEVAGLTVVAAGTVQGAAGLGAKGLGWGFSWLAKGLAMALFVGASATVVTAVVSGVAGEGPLVAAFAPTFPAPPPTRLVRSSGSIPSAKLDPASAPPAPTPMTQVAPPTAGIPVNEPVRSAQPLREQRHDVPRGERASKPASSAAPASSASPASPASPSPGVAAPRFTDEVRMLGDVRAALTAHDPARGLVVLDTFATVYPASVLTAEAEVLRIDAVLSRGDRALARKLATAFLAARPKSPYRQHVEGVLEKSATGAMR
jgi:hypothetical protein